MASKSFLIEELERRFLGRRPTGGCEDGEEVGFEGTFPRLPWNILLLQRIFRYMSQSRWWEKDRNKMMHVYKRFNKKNLFVRFNTNTGWKKLDKCKRMQQNHILLVTVISFFGRKVSKRVLSWLICYTTITHNGAKKKMTAGISHEVRKTSYYKVPALSQNCKT